MFKQPQALAIFGWKTERHETHQEPEDVDETHCEDDYWRKMAGKFGQELVAGYEAKSSNAFILYALCSIFPTAIQF
jgi:hypothetical protein